MENILNSDDLADVKKEEDFDLKSRLFKKLCSQYKNNYRMKTPCSHFFHTSNFFIIIFFLIFENKTNIKVVCFVGWKLKWNVLIADQIFPKFTTNNYLEEVKIF